MRYKLFKNELFSSKEILNAIIDIINLKHLNLEVLDLMGGTGIVGKHIKKFLESKNIKTNLRVADIDKNSLNQIKDKCIKKIVTDICKTKLESNFYDYIFIRFGFHEILKEDKETALKECYRLLKTNGTLVIIDLLPTEETQNAVNETDTIKNLLEKRPNKSYFLIEKEFIFLLNKVGFKNIKLFKKLQQKISTEAWYKTEQINKEGLEELNKRLLNLPEKVKSFFNIQREEKYITADISIGIVIGEK